MYDVKDKFWSNSSNTFEPRKRKSKSEQITYAFTRILLNVLSGAYVLMLLAGVIHAQWVHQFPTIGYWNAVLVSALVKLFVGWLK